MFYSLKHARFGPIAAWLASSCMLAAWSPPAGFALESSATSIITVMVDPDRDGIAEEKQVWTKTGKLLAKRYVDHQAYTISCEIYDPKKGCLKAVMTRAEGL